MTRNGLSPETKTLRSPGRVAFFKKERDMSALLADEATLARLLDSAAILKDSRTTKAGLVTLPDGTRAFIKRYNTKGPRYVARYLFRSARPFRAWEAALAAARGGVAVPRPLMACRRRVLGVVCRAYLVTEAVENVAIDSAFLREAFGDAERFREFCAALGETLGAIHRAGVVHGDCKLSNFYFAEKTNERPRFGAWDFDGAKFYLETPLSARAAELGRLAASLIGEAAKLGLEPPLDPMEALAATYADAPRPTAGDIAHRAARHLKRQQRKSAKHA